MSCIARSGGIHFPTLAELNAELFEWEPGEEDNILQDEALCVETEVFAVTRSQAAKSPSAPSLKPDPLPPIEAPPSPCVPEIGPLTANILRSSDRLFFIAHRVPGSAMSEWYLVRVDSASSIRANPNSMQDGRFLVEFYVGHPADNRYNAKIRDSG